MALVFLTCAAPLFAVIAIAIGTTSPGGILFRHWRMGRAGHPFAMLKFRTMRISADGPEVTAMGDARITPVGRFLRRTKLDELPELWNVIRGDMALVGPRPEALRYAIVSSPLWQEVLSVRPGVTHDVTVRLRREEELLSAAGPDHERFYREYLLPYKLRAYVDSFNGRTWKRDLSVLRLTVVAILAPSRIGQPSVSDIIAQVNSWPRITCPSSVPTSASPK